MLMVEAILISSGSNFARWNASYTDLYNRQEKVKVKNRTKFVPINADTELLEPAGMQQKIVQIVEKYNGRSFVRPSGTEDVVRVYAEAATPEATRQLADEIVALVREYE
jgi:phosphoacetylglucosamine mutase